MADETILVIEDEQIVSDLLKKKLTEREYTVSVAHNGKEGLRKVREETPDLVLLDIVMPEMDGFTVLEKIRGDDQLKDLPVIIVSNSGQPVELDRAEKLGANDWLIKTEFDPEEVIDKVNQQLRTP